MWQHRSKSRAGQQQHAADCRGKGEKTAAGRQRQYLIVLSPLEVSLVLLHDAGPSTHVWMRTEMSPYNVDTWVTCLRNVDSQTGNDFSLSVFVDKHARVHASREFAKPTVAGMIRADAALQSCLLHAELSKQTRKEGCDHGAALASTSSHQRQICLGLHNNRSHGKMLSGSSVLNTRWRWPCYFPCHSICVCLNTHSQACSTHLHRDGSPHSKSSMWDLSSDSRWIIHAFLSFNMAELWGSFLKNVLLSLCLCIHNSQSCVLSPRSACSEITMAIQPHAAVLIQMQLNTAVYLHPAAYKLSQRLTVASTGPSFSASVQTGLICC